MTPIVEIRFGSHLYGTATPASDDDFKSVFVPAAEDILLQRIRPTINQKRPKAHGEKNVAGDVDREAIALHRFLELAAEGQTMALDMLFAPSWAMTMCDGIVWPALLQNRHKLLSRRAGGFLGYCRTQANKYGIKGSRVQAIRCVVEWFDQAIEQHGHIAPLATVLDTIPALVAAHGLQHTAIIEIPHPSRPAPIRHLECCNRKAPEFTSLKECRAIFVRLRDEYGTRALQAEKNEGVDWKALSHAVRVGEEALELLNTGHITFPLLKADHIRRIKLGELPYKAVAGEIESLLERVEAAQATSHLPDAPDQKFIDGFVMSVHAAQCTKVLAPALPTGA
jgi:hypothetical protein